MLRPLIAVLATFAIIKVALDLIVGSTLAADLWMGGMYRLPTISLTAVPDIFAPIVKLFPVLPVLTFVVLLAVGLLSLLEMD